MCSPAPAGASFDLHAVRWVIASVWPTPEPQRRAYPELVEGTPEPWTDATLANLLWPETEHNKQRRHRRRCLLLCAIYRGASPQRLTVSSTPRYLRAGDEAVEAGFDLANRVSVCDDCYPFMLQQAREAGMIQ